MELTYNMAVMVPDRRVITLWRSDASGCLLGYTETSPPTRSVDLVIRALGLTAEYKEVDLFNNEHLTPQFLKINPLHTIPAIDDNGFILWGSQPINAYLVSKYAEDDSLYPKDLQKRAIVDQRLHYSNDVFCALKVAARPVLFSNLKPSQEALEKLKEVQENVEKLLTGHEFIAGDHLTLADYSYVTFMDVYEVFVPTGDKFSLTKQWFARCKSTMKDFDKVNKIGADKLIANLKQKLPS